MASSIQQCESATGVHIPLPLEPPLHPLAHPTSLGCYRALGGAPCVTQQPPTTSYFMCGKVSISILLSQFVPPCRFPGLFSMSTSLFLPANRFIGDIFLDSIYMH